MIPAALRTPAGTLVPPEPGTGTDTSVPEGTLDTHMPAPVGKPEHQPVPGDTPEPVSEPVDTPED